jgi:2-phosphoglycolate phosphatase
MSKTAILFDLDGTLVDSALTIADILNSLRLSRGLDPLPEQAYRRLISLGPHKLIEGSLNSFGEQAAADLGAFRAEYQITTSSSHIVYRGVEETLKYMTNKNYLIGLCSNKPEGLCNKILTELGLKQYFNAIAGGDTSNNPKPNPDSALTICAALGVSPKNTYFIGDTTIDQQTAEAIGATFVFFSAGYNDGVNESVCDYVISDIGQLIELKDIAGNRLF